MIQVWETVGDFNQMLTLAPDMSNLIRFSADKAQPISDKVTVNQCTCNHARPFQKANSTNF